MKWLNLRRFSLHEFQHLIEIGFFDEDERIELLDGLLVKMQPISPLHAFCVDKVAEIFHHLLYQKAWIRIQSPVTLERCISQPQPDVTVAIECPESYGDRHMNAEEILLLIEVADESLEMDQTDKLKLYGVAGITEYWIVNLEDNQLEIYQEPYLSASGEGNYRAKQTYGRNETVSPQTFPECEIALQEILPVSKEVADS